MHLTLFFTRGNSLATWHSVGSLTREILLYQALQERGMQISFVTYGTSEEEKYSRDLSGIDVLYNRWNLPLPVYELSLPWLHKELLRKSDLFKTNQMKGAHTAILAGYVWKKPVIVRMGYMWSRILANPRTAPAKAILASNYEDWMIKRAKSVVVTTPRIKQELILRGQESRGKIHIIPNYVDTRAFHPGSHQATSTEIVYVGRLAEEKNLFSLIEAVKAEDISLEIIGSGPQEQELRVFASHRGAKVSFSGSIPNTELPAKLLQAKIFILPSLFEGLPKALLEAMACGLAVIGTDVEGIRDVIQHGETGWLCQPDIESIRGAIHHLYNHPELCKHLGKRAREYILANYALDQIADQEFALYQQILADDDYDG